MRSIERESTPLRCDWLLTDNVVEIEIVRDA